LVFFLSFFPFFCVLSWILLLLSIVYIYVCVCVCFCVLHWGDEEGKNVKRNGVTKCFVANPPKKKIPTHPPTQKTEEEPKASNDGLQEDCLEVLVFQERSSSVEVRDQYWNSGRF
jgi:hypothetical protein